ncbi:hypothetical protein LX64_03214 [Chitinophaga skermanii]|uniref:Outer membrane protein with beta-barrel domain n=2 Tax=Chitinophaga skermanii TaxID=331697 RepID=A0A327QDX4_9BACT|nr:hypothetical protein LX64_03214 [Chitinophaga skermanii]
MQRIVLIICSILLSQTAHAQSLEELERSLDSLLGLRDKSQFVVGISYGNNPAYADGKMNYARSLVQKPFLSPSISYYHKSGLYANASTYYMFGATKNPWFEHDLGIGYDYNKHPNFIAGISYNHYFYADSSDVPLTPIKNELYAYFSYRKWWLEPGINIDFGWGKESAQYKRVTYTNSGRDFNLNLDVRHSFLWIDVLNRNDGLMILPVASLTFGTTNYLTNLRGTMPLGNKHTKPQEINYIDRLSFGPRFADLGVRVAYNYKFVTISPAYTVFKPLQGDDRSMLGYFSATMKFGF